MTNRLSSLLVLALSVSAATLAACGGGGGGSVTPVPTPTATPAPTPTNSSSAGTASCNGVLVNVANCTYTFQSSQAGLPVYVGGVQIGTTGPTPIATTIPFAVAPLTATFGSGATAYSVQIEQNGNGTAGAAAATSYTVYYNAAVDTGSSGGLVGNADSSRAVQSLADGIPHRGLTSARRSSWIVPDKLYVKIDASKLGGRSVAEVERAGGAGSGYDVLSSVAAVRGRVVNVPTGADRNALAAQLQQQSAVVGVYPVHYRVPLAASRVRPNDPYFVGSGTPRAVDCISFTQPDACQWNLQVIHADYAWSYTHGGSATIAIVDTGIDVTHPDLANVYAFQGTSVGLSSVSSTVGQGQNNAAYAAVQDTQGHGSAVAATADAETNDGVGFAGTAYGGGGTKNLYAYRIYPPSTPSQPETVAQTNDEAVAIHDAIAKNVDVINLSLGAPAADNFDDTGFDQGEHDAIEAAISAGIVVVASAGNEGAATLDYPASYDGVISVGATSLADGTPNGSNHSGGSQSSPVEYVVSYSNWSPNLSIVAPGGDPSGGGSTSSDGRYLHWIFSTSTSTDGYPPDQCSTPANSADVCKTLWAGTSFAAPEAAGAVALVDSALREAHKARLTPAAMKLLLEGTADNISDAHQGHGRLNVLRAVESALGYSLTLPAPPSSPAQFVAFAYTNTGAVNAAPAIADVFYKNGVPVASNGTFRIADIDPAKTPGSFRIAVWLDANGDGKVDAGDQFGVAPAACSATARCQPGTISVTTITAASFSLP